MHLPCLSKCPTRPVSILYTSDMHCAAEHGLGLVGVAALKDRLSETADVILADNGDALQGEAIGLLTQGAAMLPLMNAVGYDVAVPGNHEFDFGVGRLLDLSRQAAFPYVCSNFTRNGELVFPDSVIRRAGGLSVAFVGVDTPTTLTASFPGAFTDPEGSIWSFMEDADGSALIQAVQKAVDRVRAAGADMVVCLAHLGNLLDAFPWTSQKLIENTEGIDAVIDGHSHLSEPQTIVFNRLGNPVLLTACGTKLESVGEIRVTPDGSVSSRLHSSCPIIDEQSPFVCSLRRALAKLREGLDEDLLQPILQTPFPLIDRHPETGERIIRKTETNLGDLCADAFRFSAGAEIALIQGGCIRDGIPSGPVTMDAILRVLPYGNAMILAEITGKALLEALEWSARFVPEENGGFLQVSGMRFRIDNSVPSPVICNSDGSFLRLEGRNRVQNVFIGKLPLDPERTYRVAGADYLLTGGGDGYTCFAGCRVLNGHLGADAELIRQYLLTLDGMTAYSDPFGSGRIGFLAESQS